MAARSLFDSIHDDFTRLDLSINGARVHLALPQRQIRVTELKSILLHPSTPFAARDEAVIELITRARNDNNQWVTALLGVLLPGIRCSAGKLVSGGCVLSGEEIEAEMMAGVIEAIAAIDLDRGHLASRLTWAGYRRGLHACEQASNTPRPTGSLHSSQTPKRPWGHPDLVLWQAYREEVITTSEARLIARSRLDGVPVSRIAEEAGELADSLRHRRRRAEQRLAKWLIDR